MKYEELINSCIEIIKSYNPNIEGADSFAEKYLKAVIIYIIRKQKTQMKECLSNKYFMEFCDTMISLKY
jgi:hypothetical protein